VPGPGRHPQIADAASGRAWAGWCVPASNQDSHPGRKKVSASTSGGQRKRNSVPPSFSGRIGMDGAESPPNVSWRSGPLPICRRRTKGNRRAVRLGDLDGMLKSGTQDHDAVADLERWSAPAQGGQGTARAHSSASIPREEVVLDRTERSKPSSAASSPDRAVGVDLRRFRASTGRAAGSKFVERPNFHTMPPRVPARRPDKGPAGPSGGPALKR